MRIRAKTLKTGSPLPDRHTTADAAKKPCREYSFLWNCARLLGWKSTYFAYKKGDPRLRGDDERGGGYQ